MGKSLWKKKFSKYLGRLINNPAVDLTLIGASGNLIRRLPAKNTIVLPRLVDQILDVRGEWKDVQARFHHQVRNGEMRLIRKYGYQIETSNKDTDFEKFFHEMYIPSMKMRHGYQAHILSWTEAYECFKQGVLFLTKRDGIYVSGSVCVTQSASGVVHGLLIGVLQADQQLVKEGAQGVLYYAVAQWANTHGYEAVDFEATEPFLKKGILQYKKKWGTVIRIPRNDRKRLWLKIQRHTPAVNQFLKDNPCIMINKQGDLQGLFFVDDSDQVPADTKAEWDKLCAMPGLKGYCIYPVENLV